MFNEANAERLAQGLGRMRGAALKVGQMMSLQGKNRKGRKRDTVQKERGVRN